MIILDINQINFKYNFKKYVLNDFLKIIVLAYKFNLKNKIYN